MSAASLETGFTLAINPRLLKNADDVYEKINTLYPIAKENFFPKASKKDDPYEEIAKRVPEAPGESIAALNLPGVILERERWRVYPGGTLAAHVLGFVAYKGNELDGRYGIERYYNDVLSRNDSNAFSNFFVEIFSGLQKTVDNKQVGSEGDVVLTIEPTVQDYLESELKRVNKTYSGDQIGGIIMNPETGEIYAMGVYPTFDPNRFQEEKNVSVFGNPLVDGVYEMGSIIKPLTMAAGLDAGVVTARTTYDDKGFLELDGYTIKNYDHKGRGVVPMQEVLSQSLNTGVAYVVTKLGNKRFADYFKSFGLGEETGIDLPNETHGLIKNLESPRNVEYATASFGQGIALTPIETARALSVLGNGGHLITPHVVKQIRYDIGTTKDISYPEGKQVIKPETSTEISRMLVEVVDKALAKGKIKLDHYSVAAKTGTAQMANPNGGGYYENRYLHSFFGYFPAYNPEFVVFFFIVNPQGVEFASETFAVPFSRTVQFLINYYQVPPDR